MELMHWLGKCTRMKILGPLLSFCKTWHHFLDPKPHGKHVGDFYYSKDCVVCGCKMIFFKVQSYNLLKFTCVTHICNS